MNDLDLRIALHRDAELVGEPAPDLLEQLAVRRDKQRRQRAGMFAAALGVVVIAAGIPVGSSLLTQSDSGPAVEVTVDPTPPTTPATPSTTPVAPPVTEAPVTTAPVAAEPRECPDQATLLAILTSSSKPPADLYPNSFATLCSGEWAFTVFNHDGVGSDGLPFANAVSKLYRFVDGNWTPDDRDARCKAGDIPDDIWELTCNAG
jgi:hypothetical protein